MLPALDQFLQPLYFFVFAGIAVLCSVGMMFSRHPINGAINLIATMISLSGIYALMHSPFLAVLQVLVYAGAIMMLVVFVIMVLNQAKDHAVPYPSLRSMFPLLIPLIVGAVLAASAESRPLLQDAHAVRGTVDSVATMMFDTASNGYWLLFELTGVLLLVAAVGAVLLSKRHLETPADDSDADGHTKKDAAHAPH